MNLREFTKISTERLNESLAKKFGQRIDVDAFTTEQLMDARNKLRTKIFNVETRESFDSVQSEEFQKNKLFLDVINSAIDERSENITKSIDEAVGTVNEGAEDEAELVMAAKDMVDRVTGWMEDTSEMQTESMLELADAIRDEYGSETSERFTGMVKPALEELYDLLEQTRKVLIQGVGMLAGDDEDPMGDDEDPMGDDLGNDNDDDISDIGDSDLDADDNFGASDVAAGGEEPDGREKRESMQRKSKKK